MARYLTLEKPAPALPEADSIVYARVRLEMCIRDSVYMDLDHDLEILPVVNKIALPSARPEVVKQEIEDEIGLDTENGPLVSAKQGIGIEDVLEDIVQKVPAPKGDTQSPLRALIFVSLYDNYRGAISYVRVKEGVLRVGDRIRMMASGREFDVTEVDVYKRQPSSWPSGCLNTRGIPTMP